MSTNTTDKVVISDRPAYPRIKLDVSPVEIYCPHCETVIQTYTEGEKKLVPMSCPSCKKEINVKGAQLYLGPITNE